MTHNCTIVGQCYNGTVNSSYSTTASCYAGFNYNNAYYVYRLKFTTPSFVGISVGLRFNIKWGTRPNVNNAKASEFSLRWALLTSDNQLDKYAKTKNEVTDDTDRLAVGRVDFTGITSDGITTSLYVPTADLQADTTYFLYFWGDGSTNKQQNFSTVSASPNHSVVLEYIAQTYIDSISDTVLGEAVTVKFTPPSASFVYKVEFGVGSWRMSTGIIAPNTTAQYTHNEVIPLDAALELPNSAIGTMTATLYSYMSAGDLTQLGEADSVDFKVVVPENETKPAVDMVLSVKNDLASPFNEMYIQNLTKVGANIFAYGQYGATIDSAQLVLGNAVYEHPFVTDLLTSTGNVTVTAKATDSRGYVGKAEKSIYVIPYGKPAIVPAEGETNIVCCRCDESGYITDSGTVLKIKAKRSYSPVVSNGTQYNFCEIRYRCNGGEWQTILAEDATEDEVEVNIPNVVSSTTTAYTIEVGVIDDIGNEASAIIIVPSDKVEFHLREGGEGAAFGEYAEDARVLAVAEDWELRVKGTMTIGGKSLLDIFYPVGSVYISVNSTNPATFLGGTWERISSADFADYIWKRV